LVKLADCWSGQIRPFHVADVGILPATPSKDVGTTPTRSDGITQICQCLRDVLETRSTSNYSCSEVSDSDQEFPRSIFTCLLQTERSLHQIAGTPTEPDNRGACFRTIVFELDYLTIEEIIQKWSGYEFRSFGIAANEWCHTFETFFRLTRR